MPTVRKGAEPGVLVKVGAVLPPLGATVRAKVWSVEVVPSEARRVILAVEGLGGVPVSVAVPLP